MNFNNKKSRLDSAKLNDSARAPAEAENRLAVILAGRTGLAGSKDEINKARKQLEKVFLPQDTLVVATEEQSGYYRKLLPNGSTENLIVQPQDNGTTVAVLYAALRLAMTNPSAVLAFFRTDFHAPDADAFMRSVESACLFARRDPNLILLGISPDDAEIKNEWIELDSTAPVDKRFGIWRVRRFSTGAPPCRSRRLVGSGALLNSSVMIGTVATFLRKIRRAAPELYESFSLAAERMGTLGERAAMRAAFRSQDRRTDFSRDVLEKNAGRLLVIPVPASLRSAVGIEAQTSTAAAAPETFVNSAPKFYTARAAGA